MKASLLRAGPRPVPLPVLRRPACLQPQVWNAGDSRCKLVTLALTKHARAAAARAAAAAQLGGSSAASISSAADGSMPATSDVE